MKCSMARLATYCFALLCCTALARAQTPTQDVQIWFPPEQAEKPIALQELTIHSQIHGWIASTRIEMRFHNPNARVLEGELVLPLRPEQVVAGYALDIGGTLREGVVVPKETARVAFEEITRRGIDPGLAELTRGNVFRTRIYPLPAGGTRHIAVTIEQPLKRVGDTLQYRFPVPYTNKLASYRVKVEVDPKLSAADTLVLESRQIAERNVRNAKPEALLSLDVPIKTLPAAVQFAESAGATTAAQRATLVPLAAPEFASVTVNKPKIIAVYFDASRSALKRDLARERALLKHLFAHLQTVDVRLVIFRDRTEAVREFKIRSGDETELLSVLQQTPLDGATSFERVPFSQPADVSIVFTDADASYEPYQIQRAAMVSPGFVIALATDTPSKLGLARLQHFLSANVVNLAPSSSIAQLENLLKPHLRVSASAPSGACSGMPAIAPVRDRQSHLAWRCLPGTTISVHWQLGNQRRTDVIKTPDTAFDNDQTPASLQRVWAASYIDTMEREGNSLGALELATRYGVVTEQTSLLVLETFEDYVRYQVRPPEPQWQAEFDQRMAQLQQRVAKPDYQTLIAQWQAFKSWHAQPHESLKTLAQDYAKANAARIAGKSALRKRAEALIKRIAGTDASDEKGLQMLVRASHQLKKDWLASLSEAQRQSYLADFDKAKGLANDEDGVALDEPAQELGALQARAEPAPVEASAPIPPVAATMAADVALAAPAAAAPKPAEVAGPSSGSALDQSNEILGGTVQLQAYRADASYLTQLRGSKSPYLDYLKLAEQNSSFGFYLDCARFFWEEQKDQMLAIRVLSNLAELQIEDTTAVRMLAHQLKQWQRWNEALAMFELARSQREEEPQGWRDLALTLAVAPKQDRGNPKLALEYLWKVASEDYPRFDAIRLTALHEFNHWLARTPATERPDLEQLGVPAALIAEVPLGLRVVLGWNLDNVDMDLWVRDPLGEWAYYSQPQTRSGGQMSDDFTQGYGPESFTIARAIPGTYTVFVHYYADHQQKLPVPSVVYLDLYSPYHGNATTLQSTMRQLKAGEEQHLIGEFVVP